MMEHTVLNGTTSTTTIIKDQEERKKKKRFGPLILFTALLLGCAFYAAGQIRGRSSLASSDTTRGAITTSLMMSNDNLGMHCNPWDNGYCHQSVGIYDSQKDYCYTCGYSYNLGYCWNSQNWQCPPACNNMQEVYGKGDNQCGDPCTFFLSCKDVKTKKLCEAMGYTWDSEYGQGCV